MTSGLVADINIWNYEMEPNDVASLMSRPLKGNIVNMDTLRTQGYVPSTTIIVQRLVQYFGKA